MTEYTIYVDQVFYEHDDEDFHFIITVNENRREVRYFIELIDNEGYYYCFNEFVLDEDEEFCFDDFDAKEAIEEYELENLVYESMSELIQENILNDELKVVHENMLL